MRAEPGPFVGDTALADRVAAAAGQETSRDGTEADRAPSSDVMPQGSEGEAILTGPIDGGTATVALPEGGPSTIRVGTGIATPFVMTPSVR